MTDFFDCHDDDLCMMLYGSELKALTADDGLKQSEAARECKAFDDEVLSELFHDMFVVMNTYGEHKMNIIHGEDYRKFVRQFKNKWLKKKWLN